MVLGTREDPGSVVARLYGCASAPGAVLAPMVRAGTLPLRLLSLGLGASAVYSEELIDHKLVACERVAREDGFVDLVLKKDPSRVVFRTCALERAHVVLQLGSADAGRAVAAAQLVVRDVAEVNLNMGCPKPFSLQGGMGAALLRTPAVAEDIVRSLRRNVPELPVTCKIRLLEDEAKTLELVRRLEAAGAMAVGVHCRETHHRPSEPAQWPRLRAVVQAARVPVIANGDVYTREDARALRESSGAHCAMLARGALRNASVFLPAGRDELPLRDVLRDYTRVAAQADNHIANSLYTLSQMLRYNPPSLVRAVAAADEAIKKPKAQYADLRLALDLSEDECRAPSPGERLTWRRLNIRGCVRKDAEVDDAGEEEREPKQGEEQQGLERDDEARAGSAEQAPRKRLLESSEEAEPGKRVATTVAK